ncbi:MAG: cytochrome b [Sphingomonas sp.]
MTDAETAFDTATRIAAGDDKTRYDGFSIFLHWTTALLVLVQFVLSQTWGWFGRPTHHVMVVLHMSFGILLAAVIVTRLVWRLMPSHAMEPIALGWQETASRIVHYVLYALLATEAVLGFVLRWSGNEAMSFFGLQIAPPFAPFSRPAHHQVGEFHEYIGWAIVILAVCHALAALYHHYHVRDRVLVRMAPWARERSSRA